MVKIWRHGREISKTEQSFSPCSFNIWLGFWTPVFIQKLLILSDNCGLQTLIFDPGRTIYYYHNVRWLVRFSLQLLHMGGATSLHKTDDHSYFHSPDTCVQQCPIISTIKFNFTIILYKNVSYPTYLLFRGSTVLILSGLTKSQMAFWNKLLLLKSIFGIHSSPSLVSPGGGACAFICHLHPSQCILFTQYDT